MSHVSLVRKSSITVGGSIQPFIIPITSDRTVLVGSYSLAPEAATDNLAVCSLGVVVEFSSILEVHSTARIGMVTSQSSGVSTETYLGVGSVLLVLAAIFVAIRCAISITQTKKIHVDDGIAVVGLLFVLAAFIVQYYIIQGFRDPTTSPVWAIKMGVCVVILILFSLWTTKAPILLLYVKLFGIYWWVRWASYITLVVTALCFIAAMAITLAHCDLTSGYAEPTALDQCITASATGAIFSGFIAVFTDVIIFCLPIPAITRMNIATSKKQADIPIGLRAATIFLIHIECVVALSIGCAPAVKAFWSKYISKSIVVAKVSAYTSSTIVASNKARARKGRVQDGLSTTAVYDSRQGDGPYIMMESPQRSVSSRTDLAPDVRAGGIHQIATDEVAASSPHKAMPSSAF
ncbi:hypothetical protein F4775DRAFT_591920 [Biscogniauxia sp. FL1348]|nr:hypothetical protein F4775DRAFT_591920 [Biscogniauxia sp. FL1348]